MTDHVINSDGFTNRMRGAAAPSSMGAIVYVDMEPILEAEREKVHQAAKDLDELTQRLNAFKRMDEPEYESWIQTHFANLIASIRELQERYMELRSLVSDVEILATQSECSESEAYERVIKIRKGIERAQEARRKSEQTGKAPDSDFAPEIQAMLRVAFEQMIGGEPEWGSEAYEQLYAEFVAQFRDDGLGGREDREEKFRENARREQANRRRESRRSEKRAQASQESKGERAKRAFRILARKLHPDINPNLTQAEKDFWHEVQEAYARNDADRLEALLAVLEEGGADIGSGSIEKIKSVSRLRKLVSELGRKIRSMEKTLKQFRKNPAWNFHSVRRNPKQYRKLENEVGRDLTEAHDDLRDQVSLMEDMIESWRS